MKTKSIELGRQNRHVEPAQVTVTREQTGGPMRLSFSLSSEAPVERWYGTEVLSHDDGAIRMTRAKNGAMPLLWNHRSGEPIGMVDSMKIVDGRTVVDAHLFDTERAIEVAKMIDGGLRNVSVGYEIHEFTENQKERRFTAIDWEPMEASVVSVPADFGVGIGRADEGDDKRIIPVRLDDDSPPAARAASTKETSMSGQEASAAAGANGGTTTPHVTVTDDFNPIENDKLRAATIRKFAEANSVHDEQTIRHWIVSGKSWDAIGDELLAIRKERAKFSDSPAFVGLSARETTRFSIVKAVRAIADNSWKGAEFEADVSRTIAERLGRPTAATSFFVPVEVQQRTLQVGTAAQGGSLVGTDLQPGSFIEMLRNRSVGIALGARTLSGLVGNVIIPRQATSGAVGWIGELGTATLNELTVGALSLSPKTIAGYQQISRQLLMQSTPDAENLVNADLAAAVGLGLDTAMLSGTSTDSTQPLGIRYQSGLGTANPGTATNVSYADMIRFQSTVASSNALFTGFGYVCHPAIAAILMGKPRFTNSDTPIWGGALLDGEMVGRRSMSSLQITSGSMLGGDFSQVIIGEWGALEIAINPYAVFQSGIIGVRAMYSCDIGVRYGAAFALGTGIAG